METTETTTSATNESSAMPASLDIPLPRLREVEQMSVRAWNACKNNGLHSLRALLDHYNFYGTFTKFRHVGRLTETELTGICRKYLEEGRGKQLQDVEEKSAGLDLAIPSPDWSLWSNLELAMMNKDLQQRLGELSTSAKDLLRFIVPQVDQDVRAFDNYVTLLRQRVGFTAADRLTLQELLTVRAELIQRSEQFSAHLREEEAFRKFTALWCERFGCTPEEILPYRQAFIARRFPLFHFLDQLLFQRSLIFSGHLRATMVGRFHFRLNDQKRTLEEIGEEVGLTRERIRQLAITIPARIQAAVRSLGPIAEYLSYQPLNCQGRDLIIVDDTYAQYVNASEGVSFTSGFLVIVFEAFLKEQYDRIEEDFDAATDYLVHRELAAEFDFDDYLRRIAGRISERIPQPYTLDLLDEVEGNLQTTSRLRLRRICAVCELLANEEFAIAADDSGGLCFQRNTKKRIDEHIADLLLEAGTPLHVEELAARLNERFPEIETTPESVRSLMLRLNERFARFDTGSTYGLCEWETESSGWKSGTFADLAEEFLLESDTPRHWSEVAEYVMRYRTTTERTVFGTLKADMRGLFIFYDGGMVGLAAKQYEGVNTNYRTISARTYEGLRQVIQDMGGEVDAQQLVVYGMLHYRMPEQQARYVVQRVLQSSPQAIESEG